MLRLKKDSMFYYERNYIIMYVSLFGDRMSIKSINGRNTNRRSLAENITIKTIHTPLEGHTHITEAVLIDPQVAQQ